MYCPICRAIVHLTEIKPLVKTLYFYWSNFFLMKDKIIISLLIISIILSIVSLIRSGNHGGATNESAAKTTPQDSTAIAQAERKETIEPGEIMTRLQRNMNKLWFAGIDQNWPLANFYVGEIQETMEIVRDNKVVDEGIDLSPLMNIMGLKPLEGMQSVVNAQDYTKFKSQYMQQIANCNNCHITAKHEFVVIKEPTTPAYDNQVYTKK